MKGKRHLTGHSQVSRALDCAGSICGFIKLGATCLEFTSKPPEALALAVPASSTSSSGDRQLVAFVLWNGGSQTVVPTQWGLQNTSKHEEFRDVTAETPDAGGYCGTLGVGGSSWWHLGVFDTCKEL